MATSATPPLPPDVTMQQAPPALAFMRGAGAEQARSGEQFDPMTFAEAKLNEVATALKDVASVLVVDKPALMPIVKTMIEAGSALMAEIQGSKPQQGQPAPMSGPPDSAAQMVSMG